MMNFKPNKHKFKKKNTISKMLIKKVKKKGSLGWWEEKERRACGWVRITLRTLNNMKKLLIH